jgi:hypothetical protein
LAQKIGAENEPVTGHRAEIDRFGTRFVVEPGITESGDPVFSIAWASEATPIQVFDKCVKQEIAEVDNDVVVTNPANGRLLLQDQPIERVEDRARVDVFAERGQIVQFNTAYWSLVFWPAENGTPKFIEFVGSAYTSAIPYIIAESIDQTNRLADIERWAEAEVEKVLSPQ